MRPRLLLALVALLLPVALLAGDVFEQYGLQREATENAFFGGIRGWPSAPQGLAALRSLPADQQVAAVTALGDFGKEYFTSSAFKKRYGEAYSQSKPKGFGGLSLKAVTDQATQAATDAALGKDTQKDTGALDKDPKAQLALRLQQFLDRTADVDFEAKLDGRRFANPDYEAKPREWKMCYRAGRPASDAARAYAQAWLEELKAGKKK
jgi:hypothetical protein